MQSECVSGWTIGVIPPVQLIRTTKLNLRAAKEALPFDLNGRRVEGSASIGFPLARRSIRKHNRPTSPSE